MFLLVVIVMVLLHCSLFKYILALNSVLLVLKLFKLRVPAWRSKEFSISEVCSSSKCCPAVRCSSASNVVCRDVNVFGKKAVFLYHIL